MTTTRSCLMALCISAIAACSPQSSATFFEGARLITGDGSAPIERSAFIVDGDRFVSVGAQGRVPEPPGAARVNLTGKTVMPAMVDLHGHLGFQNVPAGTMSKDTYTRENLVDHLERLAYHGIGAVVSIADLVDRSDLRGGRTGWGDVPLRVRSEIIPGAALFRTAGTGIAWLGSGAQGHPSRGDVPYPVTTIDEAREAVRDYLRMDPEFVKIWVDDRMGRAGKLTSPMYRAIIEEAHRQDTPVAVHGMTLADAKILARAGVEGWLHVPVRGGEGVDEELVAIVRQRVAAQDRPRMWMTPVLRQACLDAEGGQRPDWVDDPLLNETYPREQNEDIAAEFARLTPEQVKNARATLANDGRNAMRLRAAGVRVVLGTDTGQLRHRIGYFAHLEIECLVAIGMTPAEAIVAATRDSADIARRNSGMVAPGKSADFIVLDANPLENIANTRRIARVYLRGTAVDRARLRAKWQNQFRRNDAIGGSASAPSTQAGAGLAP